MKKLAVILVCLLLVSSVLGVQAFAAETEQAAEPTITVVEDQSFVELDGKEVKVSELEAMGYELVLTPVMWDGEYNEKADETLKKAYEELKKIPVAEQVDDFGDEAYWHQAGLETYELVNVLEYDFFDASIVKTGDGSVVESAKVTLTLEVPYASEIRQVLNQNHNDTAWNAVNYTAGKGTMTCTEGVTGLYAFLAPEGADLSGDVNAFVPSAEQTTPTDPTEEELESERFVFNSAVWYAQEAGAADDTLKVAYADMVKTSVAELTYADGGEKVKSVAQEGDFELDKLVVSDFVDVSIVNGENVVESDQVIFEIPVSYASDVRLALHQLPDGTWKVVQLMVKPGNGEDKVAAVTVTDGGTGVYAFLVEENVREDILAGKYDRANLFA